MALELRLNPGFTVEAAIQTLEGLARGAQAVAEGGGGGTQADALRGQYLTWAEGAEEGLRYVFASPLWRAIHTSRYELLVDLNRRLARPHAVIRSEGKAQVAQITSWLEQLRRERLEFELNPEELAAVVDTNVFIHFRWYEDIEWPDVVGARLVRLVVPEVVVDELDEQSYRSLKRSGRVRSVLSSLAALQEESPHRPVQLRKRKGVTLQFLMDPAGHERQSNIDGEILDRTDHLAEVVGRDRLVLVTGDVAAGLRARNRGLRAIRLPDELREPFGEPAE